MALKKNSYSPHWQTVSQMRQLATMPHPMGMPLGPKCLSSGPWEIAEE